MKPYVMKQIKVVIKEVIDQNGGAFSDLNGEDFYDEFATDLATAVIELLEEYEVE